MSKSQVCQYLPLLALVFSLLSADPSLGNSGDWVTYVDESASRISVTDPNVGTVDDEEKDLISGDVDQDGDTDMIVVRKVPFTNAGGKRNVLFLNESGIMVDRTEDFAPDFMDETNDRDVVLIDLDGDTWLDIVTATTFEEQPRVYMNLGETGPEGMWLGFEYNELDARLPTFSPAPFFCALAAGDITGDLRPEIYFVDYDNDLEDRLLINDGNGFFSDQTESRMTAAMANSVFGSDGHIVDLNGDGFNDIVKNSASGSSPPPGTDPAVIAIYNDGTGNFDFMETIYSEAPYMIEPADFTQDDRVDLFVVDDGQDRYLINTGNDAQDHAQFSTHTVSNSPNTSFFGGNVKFADLDLDGILDVLVADVDTDIAGCGRELALLRGEGIPPDISYSDPVFGASRPWLESGVYDIEAIDIDGNGMLDLWMGTCAGNRIYMATHLSPSIFADGFETGDTSRW